MSSELSRTEHDPASGLPRFSVVVPMFNESAGVERCLRAITTALAAFGGQWPLVVVDDGSADDTPELLDDLSRRIAGIRVVHHERNRGYGAALRSGALEAHESGAEWVLFMDSDLTNPPGHIGRFVSAASDEVDYVKASRYIAGGEVRGVPLRRRIISRAGNLAAARCFGLPLTDVTNGFRAIRVAAFVRMPLREVGFPIIAEEAYWAAKMGLRCREVPTTLGDRDVSLRRSSFSYRPRVLYAYARYPALAIGDRLRAAAPVASVSSN